MNPKGNPEMKRSFRPAVGVGLISLSLFGLAVQPNAAGAAASSIVGHVYVNENTAKSNAIAIFDRHSDGSVTASSPAPA